MRQTPTIYNWTQEGHHELVRRRHCALGYVQLMRVGPPARQPVAVHVGPSPQKLLQMLGIYHRTAKQSCGIYIVPTSREDDRRPRGGGWLAPCKGEFVLNKTACDVTIPVCEALVLVCRLGYSMLGTWSETLHVWGKEEIYDLCSS